MQIKFFITHSLSEYNKKVLTGKFFFPDFSDKCPICSAKNCAVRIGFYYRWVFIFNLKIKLHIPIARYLCRRKNSAFPKLNSSHKTFSLLPSQIIPYRLLDIDSLLFIADLRFKKNLSLLYISAEFSALTSESIISLSTDTVIQYLYYLIESGTITSDAFSYATLNSFVKSNNLFSPQIQKKERRAFEVEHINQLWIADFMYGPYVLEDRKKVRSYLCAIIDDCSRLIVSARFYSTQSTLVFEMSLKNAILNYGIPSKVYTVFLDGHLSVISARIGFILIHSKVYDSASRGKIERFFRTVRDCFIPNLYIHFKNKSFSLQQLNQAFSNWLLEKYNKKLHSSIKTTPFDKYFLDLEKVKIRKIDKTILDKAFFHSIERKVNNDSTISFESRLYELPAKYIGEKVQIRFDPKRPQDLYLFENDKQILKLNKLDKHENSKFPIKFHKEGRENV